MAIYAVSDLHGQYETFLEGLRTIEFSDADYLYVVGDAIDRGPDGIKLLMHIMEKDNMDLILGNHEFMMLNSVDPNGEDLCAGESTNLWRFYNGGNKTYVQYKELPIEKRKEILDWLSTRILIKTLQVGEQIYCLTHSNYEPEYENMAYCDMSYYAADSIVWKSVFRHDSTWTYGVYSEYADYLFVTGHVPIQRAFERNLTEVSKLGIDGISRRNLVDIDGGCAMAAYLDEPGIGAIFLRLDDRKLFTIPIPGTEQKPKA